MHGEREQQMKGKLNCCLLCCVLRAAAGGGGGSRGQDSSSEDALIWSVHFTLLSSRVLLIPNKPASCGVTLVFGKHYMFGFVR